MYKYNMDIETRDKIIFGSYEPDKYMGGCRDFEDMNVETLKELVNKEFANPEECHNYSPSIEEFISWMESYDGYLVDGYVISDKRSDYRLNIVTIKKVEGIEDKDEMIAFVNEFRFADEFDIKGYAWWD